MGEYTAGELKLAADIAKKNYVKLSSKAKLEAADRLRQRGLVMVYDLEGNQWAKAATHRALLELKQLGG